MHFDLKILYVFLSFSICPLKATNEIDQNCLQESDAEFKLEIYSKMGEATGSDINFLAVRIRKNFSLDFEGSACAETRHILY